MLFAKSQHPQQIISPVLQTLIYSLVFSLIFTFSSCQSSKLSTEKTLIQNNFNQIELFIAEQNYRIEIETVYPMITNATATILNNLFLNGSTGDSAGRIDVQGDGFYLVVNQNNAKAELPFFGEKQIVTSYNLNNKAIEFDDKHSNYHQSKNEKKFRMHIQFDINDSAENYHVNITIYANKKVDVVITSSHFASISYEGKLVLND